ncbi:type I-E CRISPR-associated protein Cse2/CasB [Pseudoduganella namucuonensis]|uniref:type I-E CRISPR-associated protein Cse2/CasB n=1 Tax=Pseudoduganella namucuonensis TaxID=1035707 RepID=UPI000B89E562|nr:type I-E CRISPR-associated protein Cse2/CasB [Pseudoduganella namucuonensis]
MSQKFSWGPDTRLGKELKLWWLDLEEARANRAMLKRCATLNDVVLSPAYQRFHRRMVVCGGWPADASDRENDKLAAIAGLLAHVKEISEDAMPESFSGRDKEKQSVSEIRFRALLKADDTDDLFRSLRRTLPLLKHTLNIHALAHDVFLWGDKIKKKWAYGYRWPDSKQS